MRTPALGLALRPGLPFPLNPSSRDAWRKRRLQPAQAAVNSSDAQENRGQTRWMCRGSKNGENDQNSGSENRFPYMEEG